MTQLQYIALMGLFWFQSTPGGKCDDWAEAVQIGELPAVVGEASGVAVSRKFPGRMYHVNDSGDSGRFFITGMNGSSLKTVQIANFKPVDVEALAIGPCGRQSSCIYVADIGDNGRSRKSIEIVSVEETLEMPSVVQPRQRIQLRYPGRAEDSESFSIHPDGTLYLLTKSQSAQLFRLPRSVWQTAGNKVSVLQSVRTLRPGGLPTDMSISDDGSRFLVLTYTGAVEFDSGFRPQDIALRFLVQQEAVTYLPGSRSFIYTNERSLTPAWIMRANFVPCD